MYLILHQPNINHCNFIFCFAFDDGGSAAIWKSSALDDKHVCKDCRFIMGTADGGDSSCAGGIILWENSKALQCSDILFTSNTATYGGAYATGKNAGSQNSFLSFCFFNRNTGSCGTDAYFDPFPVDAYQHCFSTSDSDRIGCWNGTDYDSTDVLWLP